MRSIHRRIFAIVAVGAILGSSLGLGTLWALRGGPFAGGPSVGANAPAGEGSPSPPAEEAGVAARPVASPATTPPPLLARCAGSVTSWHVPILMYHLVGTIAEAGPVDPTLMVSPALFAAQMAALHAAGWHAITAATLANDMATGCHPSRRTFVVTFDDGRQDGFTDAFPVLRADGFAATYYVVTGRVGHRTDLKAWQIQRLAAAGMEIADHTVDHVGLALVPGAIAIAEIVEAAEWIRSLLGAMPTTFAYPYGNEDPAVVAAVRVAGFALALTNKDGCFESTATSLLVPRLRVGYWTSPAALLRQVESCASLPSYPG